MINNKIFRLVGNWFSLFLMLFFPIWGISQSVTLNAPTGEANYQWYVRDGFGLTLITGANAASYSTSSPGVYYATYDANSCGGATNYSVVVDDCGNGADYILNLGSIAGAIQWFEGAAAISGETAATLSVAANSTARTFYANVTPTNGCTSKSAEFTIINLNECDDLDGDGIADQDDLDDDNDGIPDLMEVPSDPLADADDDGVPAWLDDDDSLDTIGNADGLPEDGFDTDGDGYPNHLDLDSDDDGITDILEGGGIDDDNDGQVDYPTAGDPTSMTDADMDGLSDDPVVDTNNDGTADTAADTDTSAPVAGTNLPIPNTDGTGDPDFLDIDSDDDGIPDNTEAFAGGGYIPPSGNDADMDGLDDAYDNDDGTSTGLDDGPGTAVLPTDTDMDGAPDFQDLDSDNDSINDIIEAGGTDADLDGLIDTPADEGTLTNPPNSDNDNIPDFQDVDSDNDGTNDIEGTPDAALDTDGDGMVDSTTDTDGDGIPDVIDGLTGHGDSPDSDGDGVSDANDLDDDDDGIPDTVEIATALNGGDTDGDGIPDHLDLDSDNDGINDIVEAGGTDTDNNGLIDVPADEGTLTNPTDTDMDGVPDFQDVDSDNDGTFDIVGTVDAGEDADGDGMIDDITDVDGDGIPDVTDGLNGHGDSEDTDGDGISDADDLDDDNDGIPDTVEIATALNGGDTDGDGIPDHLDLDSDNDGIHDIIEAGGTDNDNNGVVDVPADEGTITNPPDTDMDGTPDFQDLDSDNDGTFDIVGTVDAGEDADGDGMIDDITDADGDGIPDVTDDLPGEFGDALDSDGDGISNADDLDDDDDGIPDSVEIATATNGGDTDGDGIPDHQDLDSDNDGINDIVEAGLADTDDNGMVDVPGDEGSVTNPTDTDMDGVPDFQETDANNDGMTDISGTSDASLDMDGDGMIDDPTDTDRDGIKDPVDGMPLVFGDAPRGIVLSVTILLQGPYNPSTGLISDNLVRSSLLPLTEPYTGLGYTHINGGGGESVSPTVLTTTGPTSVVDWIFLELRNPTTLVDILETRSALLLANGKIVDLDGVSPVRFNNSTNNSYYVAVRHRNHLAVMTPGALSLTNTVTTAHDFTNGSSFGNINGDAQKSLGGGKFGLFEADFNGDEQINAADRSIAWNSRNLTGYRVDDSSFNGVCDAAERSQCWNNRNLNSKIP